jgi:hypothetical protein
MRKRKFISTKPMKVVGIKIPDDPKIESEVREAVNKVLKPYLNQK